MEVNDGPEGAPSEGLLDPAGRVRSVHRTALRVRGDGALAAGWVFLAIFFGSALAIVLWLARDAPELLAQRLFSPIQRGQPLWNKVFIVAIIPLFIAWLILMPLDAMRFEWSEVPSWLQFLGALGLVLSFYAVFLSFRENAYLAPVVKLQDERSQSAVTTGPYRYVRHHMYSTMFLFFPATTLLLGSWWALCSA